MRTTKMLGKMRRRFELSLHFQLISTMQQPSQKRKAIIIIIIINDNEF
jgi:hypothetical protein